MRTLLVSGGSGGHLVPAMELADHLQATDRCFLMCTRRPVDRIFSADGSSSFEWETVDLQPFTPFWRWLSLPYGARQIGGIRKVFKVIGKTKPDVVVGFGGYMSGIGVMAARAAGIPTVIHEQNFIPGRANRFLAAFASAVAVSFPETGRYLRQKEKVEVTGNPMRIRAGTATVEEARAAFGFDSKRPVLLIAGGSQGSRPVNRLVLRMWQAASPEQRGRVQVLHLAGPCAEEVEQAYRRLDGIKAVVIAFLRRMDLALASATMAVSRAGATAIAEMAVMAVPSILIPYPYAAAHQRANAQWVQDIGGAVLLEEDGLSPERLRQEVERLLDDPAQMDRMRQALRSHSDGTAAARLGDLVRKTAGEKR